MWQEVLYSDQAHNVENSDHTHHAGILQEVNAFGEAERQDENNRRYTDGRDAVQEPGVVFTVVILGHCQENCQ